MSVAPQRASLPGHVAPTARVVRSLEEVERLRPAWRRLHDAGLASDIDYFLTVARHHAEVARPHVVLVERGGEPVLIVAAHLNEGPLPHRVGPWTAYAPRMRSLDVSYRGVFGDRSPDVLAAALGALGRSLEEREADAVLFRYLEVDDPLLAPIVASAPPHRREHLPPPRPHWSASIGSSLAETLASRSAKTRENVRRVARRIEQALGDDLHVGVHRAPTDAPRLFAEIDAVAERAYQHPRPIFRTSELERRLALVGLEKGWYRAYVLRVGERPIAFWTGYAYRGTFGWRGVTGYDPAYRSHNPGTYLLTRLLEDLSNDPGIHTFDIGGGDVDYKRYFGDRRWEEIDVRLLAPRLRPVSVAVVGTGVNAVHHGLRRLGAAVGARSSPTRLRRRRLQRVSRRR